MLLSYIKGYTILTRFIILKFEVGILVRQTGFVIVPMYLLITLMRNRYLSI